MANNLPWAQVVAGSNPAAPTTLTRHRNLLGYPPGYPHRFVESRVSGQRPFSGARLRMDFTRFNQYKEAPPSQDPGDWTWSPHGAWDSHIPEVFPYVRFSTLPVGDPRARPPNRSPSAPSDWAGQATFVVLVSVTEGSMSKPTELVQGTLDLLILKVLALEPMHGWAIARRIRQMSEDVLRVGQSALYPALHKLEQQGWIDAEWKRSENNRRAKYYALTRAGRKVLAREAEQWERLSAAISLIVGRT
jgi:PadR family transcriptional regulator PadR